MANQYYLRTRHGEFGPMGVSELQCIGEAGEIAPDDLVRRETSDNWHRACEVKGLIVAIDNTQQIAPSFNSAEASPDDLQEVAPCESKIDQGENLPLNKSASEIVYVQVPSQTSAISTVSFILGILALLLVLIPLLGCLAAPLALAAFVCGCVGVSSSTVGAGKGLATAGIVLSCIALFIWAIVYGLFFSLLAL